MSTKGFSEYLYILDNVESTFRIGIYKIVVRRVWNCVKSFKDNIAILMLVGLRVKTF